MHVGKLTQIHKLDVQSPSITDAGLNYLKDLKDLEQLSFRSRTTSDRRPEFGVVGIARLAYAGHSNANALAIPYLMNACDEQCRLHIYYKGCTRLNDPRLQFHSVYYMHGKAPFSLTIQERTILRQKISRGILLFADAACGRSNLTAHSCALVAQSFPNNPLVPIRSDDAFYSRELGPDVPNVQYTFDAAGGTGIPRLEGVKIKSHWAIIYSSTG